MFVHLLVKHADTQTDSVPVREDGRDQDVQKVMFFKIPIFYGDLLSVPVGIFIININLVCFHVGEI